MLARRKHGDQPFCRILQLVNYVTEYRLRSSPDGLIISDGDMETAVLHRPLCDSVFRLCLFRD